MTKQTHQDLVAERVADEVRGELARQRKTATDLAAVLEINQHTMGRRLNGQTPFNVVELSRVAAYLGITAETILARADARADAVAS